jgi:AraC-like DNA-binding protein
MIDNSKALTLINPQNGNLAFKIFSFEESSHFDHLQRLNYYSLILLQKGEAKLKADFSEYLITKNTFLSFYPYQPFMLTEANDVSGIVINFHPDFFCIHKHQKEVACNGVLFNNIYQPPIVTLSEDELKNFLSIIEKMKLEMQNKNLAQYELLVSYLKILLISASRIKNEQSPDFQKNIDNSEEPFILQKLKDSIESHYKTKHTASDYSELLNVSSNTLAKISKNHFNKTLTDLISERIIIEAKRELYLTSKPIKQIAFELGFKDEYYFSRFFKTNTEISPKYYRDTVGFARGEA